MEIFMRNIGPSTTPAQITVEVARILHSANYAHFSTPDSPLNFDVRIFPRRNGLGSLTLPTEEVGVQFLREYGGNAPMKSIFRIRFQISRHPPKEDVLRSIRRLPYVDPRTLQDEIEREKAKARILELGVPKIQTIQFGRECRDQVFSVEWEITVTRNRPSFNLQTAPLEQLLSLQTATMGKLSFNPERSEFVIEVETTFLERRMIVIRAPQIHWTSAGMHGGVPVIFFSLRHAPSYEFDMGTFSTFMAALSPKTSPTRRRLIAFNDDQAPVAPFASLSIRLLCDSRADLDSYRALCAEAHVTVDELLYPVVHRNLFSSTSRDNFLAWVSNIPWRIAFQVVALSQSHVTDFMELMTLREQITRLTASRGTVETANFLSEFHSRMKAAFWYSEYTAIDASMPSLFDSLEREFFSRGNVPIETTSQDLFQCLHAVVTPTAIYLEGPFPERSNRVMRSYPENEDSFMRVSFVEENRLAYRFDREVDGREFVKKRVLKFLKEGLWVAGRHFRFLAYSQSALKEHAVWFVKEFQDSNGKTVNASTIIASLGSFRDLAFDKTLIYCPARYGARISQAFTSTDSSLTMNAEGSRTIPDIYRGNSCFTDGVGTISPELAKAIWAALCFKKGRMERTRDYPRAFQVRFQGSKGMLSVDHLLPGRSIRLRPSMIKFDSPNFNEIDIAQAFDKPLKYFLNRPLIMILEGLGVPYGVFQTLQDAAVRDAQDSLRSLDRAALLLESHGLGTSFRLTSVMLSLHRLGLGPSKDVFFQQMMKFAVNHVLRDLKHHARIPVPDSWTLVGVADIHGYLKEGEIFACVDDPNNSEPIYLEGLVTISRSPTIHPGDVQKVHAIGRPPVGSPFRKEPLKNTVVFSTQGSRSLPSCLGGGDLDGDIYNVSMWHDLLPPRTHAPAAYDPAKRRMLDHESTMDDVADFVAEYINSDNLGIVATNWLIIADQSSQGIFDPDCLQLAALHSDAVDYPKSGEPVPLKTIPKLKFMEKPDWSAPETATDHDKYYQSQSAIGKLSRKVELPALKTVDRASQFQRRHLEDGHSSFGSILDRIDSDDPPSNDAVQRAVKTHVTKYISVQRQDEDDVRNVWDLYAYHVSRMRTICADHTLSHSRSAMLTEEEAIIGTIVASCSQPRKRRDLMSQLREQTAALVNGIRKELSGDELTPLELALERSWIAYRLATIEGNNFGARSFSWLALGAIFEVTKEIDQLERASVGF